MGLHTFIGQYLTSYTLTAVFPIGYTDIDEPAPRHFLRKTIEELSAEL